MAASEDKKLPNNLTGNTMANKQLTKNIEAAIKKMLENGQKAAKAWKKLDGAKSEGAAVQEADRLTRSLAHLRTAVQTMEVNGQTLLAEVKQALAAKASVKQQLVDARMAAKRDKLTKKAAKLQPKLGSKLKPKAEKKLAAVQGKLAAVHPRTPANDAALMGQVKATNAVIDKVVSAVAAVAPAPAPTAATLTAGSAAAAWPYSDDKNSGTQVKKTVAAKKAAKGKK